MEPHKRHSPFSLFFLTIPFSWSWHARRSWCSYYLWLRPWNGWAYPLSPGNPVTNVLLNSTIPPTRFSKLLHFPTTTLSHKVNVDDRWSMVLCLRAIEISTVLFTFYDHWEASRGSLIAMWKRMVMGIPSCLSLCPPNAIIHSSGCMLCDACKCDLMTWLISPSVVGEITRGKKRKGGRIIIECRCFFHFLPPGLREMVVIASTFLPAVYPSVGKLSGGGSLRR